MEDIEGGRWLTDLQDDSLATHYFLWESKGCGEEEMVVAFTKGCANMLKLFTRCECELPGIKVRKTF